MKKYLILLIVLIAVLSENTFSQKDTTRKFSFITKVEILEPTLGSLFGYKMYSLTQEIGYFKRHSFQISVTYFYDRIIYEKPALNYKMTNDISSLQIIPEYKFYFARRKYNTGFFAGTYLSFLNEHEIHHTTSNGTPDNTSIEFKKSYIIIGPTLGYQNYIVKHIAFEILIGAGYIRNLNIKVIKAINTSLAAGSDHFSTSNALIRSEIKIGYRF